MNLEFWFFRNYRILHKTLSRPYVRHPRSWFGSRPEVENRCVWVIYKYWWLTLHRLIDRAFGKHQGREFFLGSRVGCWSVSIQPSSRRDVFQTPYFRWGTQRTRLKWNKKRIGPLEVEVWDILTSVNRKQTRRQTCPNVFFPRCRITFIRICYSLSARPMSVLKKHIAVWACFVFAQLLAQISVRGLAIPMKVSHYFPLPFQTDPGCTVLTVDHDWFCQRPFQYIICCLTFDAIQCRSVECQWQNSLLDSFAGERVYIYIYIFLLYQIVVFSKVLGHF